MGLLQGNGRITLLRAHVVGSAFGPAHDRIDVEVVFQVDTLPGKAFGFQLRNDGNAVANRAMFDLLRDAFAQGIPVGFDYEIDDGKSHGIAIRVWIKPQSRPGPGVGGPIIGTVIGSVEPLDPG